MEADNRPVLEGKTIFRPADWALVETSIGTMAEPFQTLFSGHGVGTEIQNYDASDEMRQVNDIQYIDLDKLTLLLSPAGVIGGGLIPRVGR